MGQPDESEYFEKFIVEDISIFIDKSILQEYTKGNIIHINIEGYGKYRLEILDDDK